MFMVRVCFVCFRLVIPIVYFTALHKCAQYVCSRTIIKLYCGEPDLCAISSRSIFRRDCSCSTLTSTSTHSHASVTTILETKYLISTISLMISFNLYWVLSLLVEAGLRWASLPLSSHTTLKAKLWNGFLKYYKINNMQSWTFILSKCNMCAVEPATIRVDVHHWDFLQLIPNVRICFKKIGFRFCVLISIPLITSLKILYF